MMSINFVSEEKELLSIIEELGKQNHAYKHDSNGFQLFLEKKQVESIQLVKTENKGKITISHKNQLARAVTNWLIQAENQHTFSIEEKTYFEEVGVMIDCSRNAVPTLNKLKEWVRHLSLLGYTQLMLYTEDTYEVPSLPYFGHYRGGYTQNEIKALDAYAQGFGIDLIPCIQTLAHLENPLKWFPMRDIKDTNDILLVGEEKTYDFIEALIASVANSFSSDRIHIGMDEAQMLGLGNYLNKNGYQDRFSIMNNHLKRVMQILDKYQLKPMMWSDMFFRLGSKTGDYYDLDSKIPADVIKEIPDIEMVYWDYYHNKQSDYETLIKSHFDLERPTIFAGATWTFNGMVPNYSKSFITTDAALKACKNQGVKEVFCTLWLDDGAETLLESAYPGLAYFAAHNYSYELNKESLHQHFSKVFETNMSDLLILNRFDTTPGVDDKNIRASHPSKFSLWQDPLLGLYDGNTENLKLNQHYENLADALKTLPQNYSGIFKDTFRFYTQLAQVLSIKADLGKQLYHAYQNEDHLAMTSLKKDIEKLICDVEVLRTYHRSAWFNANKAFGWEVLDIRYGGLISRLNSTHWRVKFWLETKEPIEELDVKRLPMSPQSALDKGNLGRNLYQHIVSASKLSNV